MVLRLIEELIDPRTPALTLLLTVSGERFNAGQRHSLALTQNPSLNYIAGNHQYIHPAVKGYSAASR
jgi:hypothetical protein